MVVVVLSSLGPVFPDPYPFVYMLITAVAAGALAFFIVAGMGLTSLTHRRALRNGIVAFITIFLLVFSALGCYYSFRD